MKTYIIYLAAGNSRRFKEDKLHALFKGKELYLYGIDTLKQLLKYRNDLEIIVVSNTINIQEKYIHSYKSPLSERGISYSIKAALNHINQDDDYQMMFMVADQPYLSYQTLNKMIDTFNQSSYSICSLMFKDRVGNPVIFSKEYFNELYNDFDKEKECKDGVRSLINIHKNVSILELKMKKNFMILIIKMTYKN